MDETPLSPPEDEEEDDVVVFKRSHFYAVFSLLAFCAGLLTGFFLWGRTPANPATAAQVTINNPQVGPAVGVQDSLPTPTPRIIRYDIPTDGYPSYGPEDAPIVIVEFSDYQCPFCERWYAEVYRPLFEAYPDQIRLVYRNLPLTSIHPDAFPASEAAMCAGDQNAYWPFHDKLFSGERGLGRDAYIQYATDLGLDMDNFTACIDENRYKDFVQADMDFALDLGVRSTPTFFINGLAVVGAQPLDVFQMVIDQELAGKYQE